MKQVSNIDGSYSGSMMGLFSPDEFSKIENPNAGCVFLYMFRRFGPPEFKWDRSKTLVRYILATTKPGVLLTVEPNVTGAGTFGYFLRGDIFNACSDEDDKPWGDWHRDCREWIKEEHGIEIIHMFIEPDQELLKRVFIAWAADKEESYLIDNNDIWTQFQTDQDKIATKYIKLYEETHPHPEKVDIMDRNDESVMKQCYIALRDAVADLGTPVMVRDVEITIYGEVNNERRTQN